MQLRDFLEGARGFRNLGDAVMEQADEIVADPTEDVACGLNVNALNMVAEFLRDLHMLAARGGDEELAEEADELRIALERWGRHEEGAFDGL